MNMVQQIESAARQLDVRRGRQACQKEDSAARAEATYAALVRNGGACSCTLLSMLTGFTRKSTLDYLRVLISRGLVVKDGPESRSIYQIAPRAGLRTHQVEPDWLDNLEEAA